MILLLKWIAKLKGEIGGRKKEISRFSDELDRKRRVRKNRSNKEYLDNQNRWAIAMEISFRRSQINKDYKNRRLSVI